MDASAERTALNRFGGAINWVNSPPLTAAELRGKVVLVDFWTYTCINWIRTAPYVRTWAEKYKESGLVVIGVHTPEFEFEKDLGNVRRSILARNITYPVAIDSNYVVWRAFENRAWPAIYLIDAKGRVRYNHLGEEAYERTEKMIQKLLEENGAPAVPRFLATPARRGAEAAPDWASLRSPENYLGSIRTTNFTNSGSGRGGLRLYTIPSRLPVNHWALSGGWSLGAGSIVLYKPNGRIAYKFHARDLHLVMGPTKPGASVHFRILIDGNPPGSAHGSDVDEQGVGAVTEQRMHQLIRQPGPIRERHFEIEFLDPGVEAFSFTFG
jgi:thiol-disulfide isomerase/thioredoxin